MEHFTTKIDNQVKKPQGKNMKPTIELCARNLPKPMYHLMLELCYFCQKNSSDRDCFLSDSGKMYFSVQLCKKCVQYNTAIQETARCILNKQLQETKQIIGEPEPAPLFDLND
jgi:hypothetical protein